MATDHAGDVTDRAPGDVRNAATGDVTDRAPDEARAPLACDTTWRRHGHTVLAGSPLRLFRLSDAGVRLAERLEDGTALTAAERSSLLVERWLDAGAVHPVVVTAPRSLGAGDTTAGAVTVVTPQLGGVARDDGRITVDDGSDPPVDGATIRLDRNQGPAAARNAARPVLDGEFVAFLDADVEAEPDWYVPLLAHFDDPRVGLVAPQVRGEPGSPLDLGADAARICAGTRVSYVPGAALVVRRSALDSIGWFDERLRFGEDVDLVWRLDDAGWWCRYEPAIAVWHRPRATWRRRLRQHAGYGTSAAPLALRHPSALAPMRSNGWTAASWALAAMTPTAGPALGAALAVASAAALPRRLPDLPRSMSLDLALRGHLLAGRQLAAAVRRAWWPIVGVAALRSRRARWILAASVLSAPRSAPTDVAYGWGLWRGMLRHRTVAPIVPQISAWPQRRRPPRAPQRRPSTPPHGPRRPLDGAGR